jgi:hypothetical protein
MFKISKKIFLGVDLDILCSHTKNREKFFFCDLCKKTNFVLQNNFLEHLTEKLAHIIHSMLKYEWVKLQYKLHLISQTRT